ncbi:MAG: hypothetical protein RQM92_12410 [Candidatus Syntrophopropionicum ammoniitolerans]
MKWFSGLVTGFSRVLDQMAAFFLVVTMVLIVANILLRVIFKASFLVPMSMWAC